MQVLNSQTHVQHLPILDILLLERLLVRKYCKNLNKEMYGSKDCICTLYEYRTDARLSMLSTVSQPTQSTPHYVAELTEAQNLIADIPPLVIQFLCVYFLYTKCVLKKLGTSRI